MTVEEDDDEEKGRRRSMSIRGGTSNIIVVGVKVGSKGHELLTWALMKAAQPADQVIALYVLTHSSDLSFNDQSKANEQITSVFNSAVGIYEGFCSLKQVDLQFKITHGSSVQKALTDEAKQSGATKLILGASRHKSVRMSISLAKSCAKRLSCSSSVIVVENGKIVFEKQGAENLSDEEYSPRLRLFSHMRWILRRRPSRDFDSITLHDNSSFLDKTALSSPSSEESSQNGKIFDISVFNNDDRQTSLDNKDAGYEIRDSGSLSSCDFDQTISETSTLSGELNEDPCTATSEQKTSNVIVPAERRHLPRGWSFVRAIVSLPKLPIPLPLTRHTSVIEWALQGRNKQTQTVEEPQELQICQDSDGKHEQHLPTEAASAELISSVESFSCNRHSDSHVKENALAISIAEVCESKPCKLFTYQELQSATSNFSQDNFLGKGGWSHVYRGILPDGSTVAVKLLNPSPEAEQEVLCEVEILTSVKHQNIITLIGYCIEEYNCLLVYDYVSRGSLEQVLQDKEKEIISWTERMKVAVGIAQALDCLHNKCLKPVIHGDVKSSNILISENFEPQLSDFGLARCASTSSSHISCSDILGTFGYLAPEYFVYGKINDKTDVYAFGVVLLELITGKRPIDARNSKSPESLVIWARPLLQQGDIKLLVDQSLQGNYNTDELQRLVLAAYHCTRQSSQHRPGICQILRLLNGEDDLSEWDCNRNKMEKESGQLEEDDFLMNPGHDLQNYLDIALLEMDSDTVLQNKVDITDDTSSADNNSDEGT